MVKQKEWFETWFDTPQYHVLYKNRNYSEAEQFITNLISYLKLPDGIKCLDLACGKGRHSVFLNKNGWDVTGLDLSAHNIQLAKQFENEALHFFVHDMREVFGAEKFDLIFNLFTSFGYFENYDENLKVLLSVNEMLDAGGIFVIDFMNVDYVLKNLVKEENKSIDGIDFNINRTFDGQHIIKTIQFKDKGEDYTYQEKVQAITKKDLSNMLEKVGFKIKTIFGDIKLNPYNKNTSDRLIIIAIK